MNDHVENELEYKGYELMKSLVKRLYQFIKKANRRLKTLAEEINFAQFMMKFGERNDDIYIVAYPKSGTTLMQVILYQLTTSGGLDFDHIYDVSPWIRNAAYKKQEPVELPSPRLIKSHDYYHQFDKNTKGKFIFVYRNGMDAAVSLYHQNVNYNKSDLDFEKFTEEFLKPRKKSWFNYSREWFRNKNNFPILYVQYEDLLKQKESEIMRIKSFCNFEVGDETIRRALELSSFECMKKHQDKFGEQPDEKAIKVFDQFIRKAEIGEGKKAFTNEQQEGFLTNYRKIVQAEEHRVFNK